jgi:hypothetical protein
VRFAEVPDCEKSEADLLRAFVAGVSPTSLRRIKDGSKPEVRNRPAADIHQTNWKHAPEGVRAQCARPTLSVISRTAP